MIINILTSHTQSAIYYEVMPKTTLSLRGENQQRVQLCVDTWMLKVLLVTSPMFYRLTSLSRLGGGALTTQHRRSGVYQVRTDSRGVQGRRCTHWLGLWTPRLSLL